MNWKLCLIPLLLIVSSLYGQDTSEIICRPRSEFQAAIIKFKQLDDCKVERDSLISLSHLYKWQNAQKDSLLLIRNLRIESYKTLLGNRDIVIKRKNTIIISKDKQIKGWKVKFRIAEVVAVLSIGYAILKK